MYVDDPIFLSPRPTLWNFVREPATFGWIRHEVRRRGAG
jgi:hypothetical protein